MKKKQLKIRMNTYEKRCPYCSKNFICHNRGRRWCPDSNCKSMFYNLKNLDVYHRNKNVIQINERNRNILMGWVKAGVRTVNEDGLTRMGFAFDAFFRHTYNEPGVKAAVYEYLEYGLKHLNNGLFEIVPLSKPN